MNANAAANADANAAANAAPNADANDAPNAAPNADANDAPNDAPRVCVVFPYGTDAASRKKGLNGVVRCLENKEFTAVASDDRRDVFILTPESTGCIETLLNPSHPHRIRGMDATFNWYVPRFENNQCSICFGCLDNEHSTKIPCEHEFHTRCLGNWATVCSSQGRQRSCPLCRAT